MGATWGYLLLIHDEYARSGLHHTFCSWLVQLCVITLLPLCRKMNDQKLSCLVVRMATKSTLAECLSVFTDIMEYEGVSVDLWHAFFRRAWAALGDRTPEIRYACLAGVSLSLFRQGACRTRSVLPLTQRHGF